MHGWKNDPTQVSAWSLVLTGISNDNKTGDRSPVLCICMLVQLVQLFHLPMSRRPTLLATMAVQAASPVTFNAVRPMSKMASRPRIMA